jgi:hypothetical protein
MNLELYEEFNRRFSIGPQREPGDAIKSFCPMITDLLLNHLKEVADVANIDGWMDYVDPELTYYENKAQLKSEADAAGFKSPFKSEREAYVEKMNAKEKQYEEKHKGEKKNSSLGRRCTLIQ